MLHELIESFDDLPPAQQALVLAAYTQQEFKWVPVGTAGFVWQDNKPPRRVVKKSRLQEALQSVQAQIDDLGYSTLADIIAIFEIEKLTLSYSEAMDRFRDRVRVGQELVSKKQTLIDFIAELTE